MDAHLQPQAPNDVPPRAPTALGAARGLIEAVSELATAESLDDVTKVVRTAARTLTGADGATFVLREGDSCHYADEDAIAPLWKGRRFPLSACVSGWAMLHRVALAIPDIYADPRVPIDAYRPTFVKSMAMVPIRLESPVGAIGIYWANARPIPAETLEIVQALADATSVSMRNLSLQDELEEKQRMREQLEAADRMATMGVLAAGVAHEINNPLSAVLMNLLTLEEELRERGLLDTGDFAALVNDTRDAAERLRDIVTDVRVFSRTDPGEPSAVDVRKVAESSLRMARCELSGRCKVVREYEPVPAVLATEAKVGQILLNLIVNAAQAFDPERTGNELRIRARHEAINTVVIEVSDNGPGIPPEVARKLFSDFVTTKPIGKGTGMGLVLSHRLAAALGGSLSVSSTPVHGTTFRLELPRARTGHTSTTLTVMPGSKPSRRARVLVVDDEPMVRMALLRTLGKHHDVVETGSPVTALEMLGRTSFDVILCDLLMPEMPGTEFRARVESLSPKLAQRIVFVTGIADGANPTGVLGAEDSVILGKPLDVPMLMTVITRILEDNDSVGA